jgi:hypothetical protein
VVVIGAHETRGTLALWGAHHRGSHGLLNEFDAGVGSAAACDQEEERKHERNNEGSGWAHLLAFLCYMRSVHD